MNVKALAIHLGTTRLGVLFQYALSADAVINRFVPDESLGAAKQAPALSMSLLAPDPQAQAAIWRDVLSRSFNGRYSGRGGWLLPAFFQNLLPEGVFRDHVAELRDCAPNDHFEMLAACGRDLPGNVYALPVILSRDELARYVTQGQDALEMSVTADPLDDGVSLSGVQPKLGVIRDGDRYVGRTKDQDTHIIAKLPVVGQPRLPEVEDLTLRLARAAGVDTCEATLEPLERLGIPHGYDLGDSEASTRFLAVTRFDRSPAGRIHVEDFAQIFSRMPEDKYGAGQDGPALSYVDLAMAMMTQPSMGQAAVHELLRRLVVNELVGNPDMHLKNIGVRYLDGVTPTLSPAYDLVAYAVYHRIRGHALRTVPESMAPMRGELRHASPAERQALGPQLLKIFCAEAGISLKPAEQAITRCVKAAYERWPAMIEASALSQAQKQRLMAHVMQHRMIQSLARRAGRATASALTRPAAARTPSSPG